MKNRLQSFLRLAPVFIGSATSFIVVSGSAHAADWYWDSNGTTAGAGTTAPGTWGTSNFWSTSSNGDIDTTAWTAGNTAVFSAGTDATGTYTVNIFDTQSTAGLKFEEGNVTLSGGTGITLTAAGVDVASGATGTISTAVGGGAGLTKTGVGTLTLSGVNGYTGTTAVNGGTLILGPTTTNNTTYNFSSTGYTLSNSATLRFDLSGIGDGSNFITANVGTVNTTGGTVELYSTATKHGTLNNAVLLGWSGAGAIFSGSGNLTMDGGGFIDLNTVDALKNFTGTLSLKGGTFQLQGGSTSTVGNFNVQFNGGTLDVRTDAQKVGALNGTTGTIISSAGGTLSIGNNGANGDFGGNITAGTITKVGAGTQILSGTNTYTGGTNINEGTLVFKAPSNADWTLNGGTKTIATGATMKVDLSTQTNQFRNTNIGAVVLNGTLNLSGTAAHINGFYIVNGLSVTSGAGNIDIIDNGSVIINSANALNNFTGTINVGDNVGTTQFTTQGSSSTSGTFSMNITSNGTYDLRTDSFVMGALNGSGAIIKSHNGVGGTLTLGNGGADGNYTGLMTDQATVYNVTKTGAGTQILGNAASTYSGVTTVNGGVLSVTTLANGGAASSIGDSASLADNLVINGGTLKYTGGGASTNRNFTIGTSGGTLDASGSGALTITGAPTMSGTDTARTLTLSGTNTGANTLQGAIGNNGTGATSLTKSGAGKWELSAANSYTGKTTVSGGTLALTSTGTLGTTSEVAFAGGTLDVSLKAGGLAVTKVTGSGNVIGSLAVTTELAIGNSAGTVNFQGLTVGNLSTFEVGGGNGDLANVTAALSLGGTLDLNLLSGESYVANQVYTLFAYNNGNLTGTFSGLADGATFTDAGGIWKIDYDATNAGLNGGDTGGINERYVTVTAVPEPAAALLGSLGLLALLRRRRA